MVDYKKVEEMLDKMKEFKKDPNFTQEEEDEYRAEILLLYK